jgi:hypothetical protein
MQDDLDERDLTWLRHFATDERPADNSIPPITLGRLLKHGFVRVDDKLLSITPTGRARLRAND